MLVITMGDPNGIGPELLCRYLSKGEIKNDDIYIMVGPESPLIYFCNLFSIPPFWTKVSSIKEVHGPGIFLYGLEDDFDLTPGRMGIEGGRVAGTCLEVACGLLKETKGALVTCPLNKEALIDAGFHFPGHTEFLANYFGLSGEDVCMHLCGEKLRVSLVTTHPPLKQVPSLLTIERIVRCLNLTWEMLLKLEQGSSPIAVCGLNPHAGEGGKIGKEEIEIISPAISLAQDMKIPAKGPYPGDTIFYRAYRGEFSAVLAMYHDQGLAPLKLVHFHRAVNITLGLPIVRTSVDHGTAYDLVGKGIASCESLHMAISLARKLL